MKRLLIHIVVVFTALFACSIIAQQMGTLRKGVAINFPEKVQTPLGLPLTGGTYTIGLGGSFPTIDSAFNKLSIDGIAGAVTLELIDNLYTAPTDSFGFFLNGPIPGAGLNRRVVIKPATNKNVTIEGNQAVTISFMNTSYVTLDGVGLTGSTTLTIHTLFNNTYNWNDCLDFWNNSDHNVIQNITFISEDYGRYGVGPAFWTRTGFTETADSNLIQNNFIKSAGYAIYVSAYNSSAKASGNIVKNNFIGSPSDSLIAWGIQLEHCQNTIVENNIVQNLKVISSAGEYNTLGINSYWGTGDIIRSNVVHNLRSGAGYTGAGILLSGGIEPTHIGSNNLIYNNMVYDIRSPLNISSGRIAGIEMWNQSSPKIYYNTVYLYGTGANMDGSAALYIYGSCTNIEAKNNIFVNTRDETFHYASAIFNYVASNLTTDYNILYCEPSQYNCFVRVGKINYNTLAAWQSTGKDLNSNTEMPNFIAPDLHINTGIATFLESTGTPIVGMTTDLDGDLRNTTAPDIGADEFNGTVVPVEFTSFSASVMGAGVILNWSTATELNNQAFEVQRKFGDNNFTTIGSVKGHGTTTSPNNYTYVDKLIDAGKYFYRLKQIDYGGKYEYSQVVEVNLSLFSTYKLEQNYPNPFNPVTTINYSTPSNVKGEMSNVKLKVFDVLGNEISTLVNEEKEAGNYEVEFNAEKLSSGVYFYQLKAGNFLETKKMILLR